MACVQVCLVTIFTAFQMENLLNHNQTMSTSFVINVIIIVICGNTRYLTSLSIVLLFVSLVWTAFSLLFLFHGVFWDKQTDIALFLVSMALVSFYITIEFAFTIDYNSIHKLVILFVLFLSFIVILVNSCDNYCLIENRSMALT